MLLVWNKLSQSWIACKLVTARFLRLAVTVSKGGNSVEMSSNGIGASESCNFGPLKGRTGIKNEVSEMSSNTISPEMERKKIIKTWTHVLIDFELI